MSHSNALTEALNATPRDPQYLFTVEIILKGGDVAEYDISDAIERIRGLGSFEVTGVKTLARSDKRRL